MILLDKKEKALIFIEHVEKHLEDIFGKDNAKVICKICGKNIDEIVEEEAE